MTVLWTSEAAVAATSGRATVPFSVTGLSIDTRSIKSGDLFVALKDVRDGHDFVRDALAKGAGAALVSRIPDGCTEEDPLLVVPDVLAALEGLARAARARTRAKVIAVTGSVGKTSTKEMLRTMLSTQGDVHAAEASFNNHWGVPLTLARMPVDADYAIIEIGMNHPGEIAPLTRLARPDVALITTVAPAHMEAFGSLAGIAREKAAIFEGLVEGGTAIVPSGLKVTPILKKAAAAHAQDVRTFGDKMGSDYRIKSVQVVDDVTVVQAVNFGQLLLYKLDTPGKHFAMNALGALVAVHAVGADVILASINLGRWKPYEGRGAREKIYLDILDEKQNFDLYDDAYNANPVSLAAALDVLAGSRTRDNVGKLRTGRRIAVLGDMLELGEDEMAQHAAIADLAAIGHIDQVHCVGPRMRALWGALPAEKRGEWHKDATDMVDHVRHLVDAGDVVLVKGSKGSRVSLVVEAFKKLGQAKAAEAFKGQD